MKIIVISDTHCNHGSFPIPDGDLVIHCGDFSRGTESSMLRFNDFLGSLPHKHKIIIAGNHDKQLETFSERRAIFTNAIYLQDEAYELYGIKFYGSPYTPKHLGAFQLRTIEEEHDKWNIFPSSIDILITHGPPFSIGDRTRKNINVGSESLLHKIQQINPILHLFGHIHEAYGIYSHLSCPKTIFANCASTGRIREYVHSFFVFVLLFIIDHLLFN
eukprot:TRINITY_DN4346_c0_g1_i3.p1 TRINITY_DN4346_c0_g1~~TRINITY_DN4346_c0_g1_i3.p1  ORF type:complete len:217 (+),score=17.53 TRINITY_DN4346_c0_g1_i3:22-672(+)